MEASWLSTKGTVRFVKHKALEKDNKQRLDVWVIDAFVLQILSQVDGGHLEQKLDNQNKANFFLKVLQTSGGKKMRLLFKIKLQGMRFIDDQ
jgi:hypothetical protein